ncbi:TasA family protein [Haloarcula salina]|uniref:M73 family metallopeptidase n=1 Tax=Haloarcula salina TaxID=1429914 RepID=A0AA41FZZ4_9EURY|nr:TasA family protein [Haloarcula salina]MBV0901880.1 M73 family metallopeptidase [Haloarcula salina]
MDRKSTITRRRLLGGLVTAGTASAAAGAGTAAYFTDTEASSDNQVSTGTLTLGFDGTAAFDFSASLAPGETTQGTVTLVNAGSLPGSLDVDVQYTNSDARNNSKKTAREVAERLDVTTLTYGGTDRTGQITDGSPPTLHDLATNDRSGGETTPNDLIDLPDPASGADFTVGFQLQNVGNQFKKEGVAITVTFQLNQHDSQ